MMGSDGKQRKATGSSGSDCNARHTDGRAQGKREKGKAEARGMGKGKGESRKVKASAVFSRAMLSLVPLQKHFGTLTAGGKGEIEKGKVESRSEGNMFSVVPLQKHFGTLTPFRNPWRERGTGKGGKGTNQGGKGKGEKGKGPTAILSATSGGTRKKQR